jgi:hypothetical protein
MAAPTLNPTPPAAADPLAGLRDWHLPGAISWWPPAPGWWLVAGLVLVTLLFMLVRWRRRRRQAAAARAALNELRTLRVQLGPALDGPAFAAAVSVLLRRLALARFPRERVAGLSGASWLAFLDATGGGEGFTRGAGLVLGELPYRDPDAKPVSTQDLTALADLAERWIRANREVAP